MAGSGNDVTSAELEKLLLDEVSTSDQLTTMRAQLDQLLKVVNSLAERNATQVRTSVEVVLNQIEKLESVPSSPCGKGRKTAKAAAAFVESLSDIVLDKCSIMRDELENLKQVERREHALRTALSDKISPLIHKLCIQAGHIEESQNAVRPEETLAVIEQLNAHEYEGTVYHAEFDPVGAARALSDKISPLIHELCIQESQNAVRPEETPAVIEQLNAHEYEGTVYHAEFDPVGAAR
ncbi:unnamed protein product, partial [Heligmosomoides polygyrus]|uniref:Mediator complex subunit 4 n=1 Tax=Heligmosomoides polygyrus TaxID=6339 RepID=A0A183GSB9_HELPZ